MWSIFQKIRRSKPADPPEKPIDGKTAASRWLEREGGALLSAIDSLNRIMADPALGGPGFLTVQLPTQGDGAAAVSCQYPNISEILYRRVLRGTAADLLEAGIPAALLDRGLRWEAESGTVVVLTMDAAPVGGEAAALLTRLHSRNQLLGALAGELARLCPGMEVRALAGYILLTPTPAALSDPPPAVPGGGPDSGRSR